MFARKRVTTLVSNTVGILVVVGLGWPLTYAAVLLGADAGVRAALGSGGVLGEDVGLIAGGVLGSASGVLAAGVLATGAARVVRRLMPTSQ